jgi:hypothetical protein
MNATTTLGLGALLLTSLSTFSLEGRETRPSFVGEVTGEITGHPAGEARFGAVAGEGSSPGVFTLSLGANGQEGSILFTRTGSAALGVGTYTVTDGDGGGDDVRALVMTGSATHPTGVFRGQSGELVITSVSESTSTGTFRVSASGFLAASPELEDRPVTATGWFRASRD